MRTRTSGGRADHTESSIGMAEMARSRNGVACLRAALTALGAPPPAECPMEVSELGRYSKDEAVYRCAFTTPLPAEEGQGVREGVLANLTRTAQQMQQHLSQQERTDVQQERIELAARELNDVSERLQAAANALRESI